LRARRWSKSDQDPAVGLNDDGFRPQAFADPADLQSVSDQQVVMPLLAVSPDGPMNFYCLQLVGCLKD